MDIKLKNIRYSMGAKTTAVILIWLCFLSTVGGGMFLLQYRALAGGSYFDTQSFRDEFINSVYSTAVAGAKLNNIESSKASAGEEVRELDSIKRSLSHMVNYIYYIKGSSGEVLTNINASNPVALIEKQTANVYFSQSESRSSIPLYDGVMDEMLSKADYEVYAAVQEPLKQGDIFYDNFMRYSRIKEASSYSFVILILALSLLIIAAVYLAIVAGRKEKGGQIVYKNVDRIYIDVHTLLVLAAAFLSMTIVVSGSEPNDIVSLVIPLLILSADAFIGISYVLSVIRQIKGGRILENTLILLLYRRSKIFVKLCFEGKIFRVSVLFLLLGYGFINGVLFDVGVDVNRGDQEVIISGLILAFNAAVIYFSAKSLLSLSQIMKAAKEISSGNLDYTLNNSEISVAFLDFAEDIKNIQGGLKKAVAEAVRGERMKTELITNVSHDLKTPLTSIINYVDLLKKEELDNQRAEGYVSVLEEKSARLKQLVEDLVEVSKASSGNLALNAEKLDLHELVLQACGEYEEKAKKAALDIRISAEEKNIYIYADGKQMWRIIENLLSNAIKYSMSQSRVYVSISKNNEYGALTIKNVSAFPLDIPPEQLTERFIRGDAARTTEGSGLGLSIAQSLTKLQGGSFKVEIDGDLFKVNVEIPVWVEG